jgi:hypothetical protein
MWLTHAARLEEEQSPSIPSEVLEPQALLVLSRHAGKSLHRLSRIVGALGQLGGHEPYKIGPPPGVKTIWLGLRRLDSMLEGFRLAKTLYDVTQD